MSCKLKKNSLFFCHKKLNFKCSFYKAKGPIMYHLEAKELKCTFYKVRELANYQTRIALLAEIIEYEEKRRYI